MKFQNMLLLSCSVFSSISASAVNKTEHQHIGSDNVPNIKFQEMKYLGSISDRFQSYNIEMAEVVGGAFWKPYKDMKSLPSVAASSNYNVSQKNTEMYQKNPPVNLYDKRLLNLAKGLAPAYVRVSGTWANAIYFQDNDNEPLSKAPEGFANVLTRKQWKGVLDFIKATNSELVTSFAVSNGVRDNNGVWTPIQADKIVNYTKSLGGNIAAAELFNEPNLPTAGGDISPTYNVKNFAKDVASFNLWAKKVVPTMLVLGPGSMSIGDDLIASKDANMFNMEILSTNDMLSATPKPIFDVFSYHYYGAVSMRMLQDGPFSIKAKNALTDKWLKKTELIADYYGKLKEKYLPGMPLWITETSEAAAGGDPFSATYLDTFRYLHQLGSLAKKGIQVVIHNTLASSEYSLIDQKTHLPKPNYWAALLWAKLMGTEVYDAGEGKNGIYLFVHSTKGKENGRSLLVINTNNKAISIKIPKDAEKYTLTSKKLQGEVVFLNGKELKLTHNDTLPKIMEQKVKAGYVELPALSSSFLLF